jgi:hypothetical protein
MVNSPVLPKTSTGLKAFAGAAIARETILKVFYLLVHLPNPARRFDSLLKLEIVELIANDVHANMMQVVEELADKYSFPVFDHECTSAFEETSSYLRQLQILRPIFDAKGSYHQRFSEFACEPSQFMDKFQQNGHLLPDNGHCLLWLWGYVGQRGVREDEPFLSFLEKEGVVSVQRFSPEDALSMAKRFYKEQMSFLDIPDTAFPDLSENFLMRIELTKRGRCIDDASTMIAEGRGLDYREKLRELELD